MENGIMIDIETLGTKSTSAIVSIGAVEFNSDGIVRMFYQRVDIDDCLKHGLTVDGPTVEWWMCQGDAARAVFDDPGIPLDAALVLLAQEFDWGDKKVWCNGLNFDLPILDNAYAACGFRSPWAYYNGRDYRTLVKEVYSAGEVSKARVEPAVAHNALEDAKAQALTLIALLNGTYVEQRVA